MKLNIASGPNVFPGWVNLDREDPAQYLEALPRIPPASLAPHQRRLAEYLRGSGFIDFRVKDLRERFPEYADESVEMIYLGQVIEHLNPLYEAPMLLKECHRMLAPGGILRVATPDLDLLVTAYINSLGEQRAPLAPGNVSLKDFAHEQPAFYKDALPADQLSHIMFGAAGPKSTWDHYEGHMHLYTPETMERALHEAGFTYVFFCEPGKSSSPVVEAEVVDSGASHSLFVEGVR